MGNMSYCRFENTSRDMQDCLDAIWNNELDGFSTYEIQGFLKFVELAKQVNEMYGEFSREELLKELSNEEEYE
jgi:hypothetical protein